ncbi:hypothetical protein BDN71DRAFT_1436336 [Pleurotus eryngii]|uniref:Uncharacterized protein n=1 Tax=Pleurotus eryngii TaxID=5323 RepID=A0A9P5ZIK6_PLEER|nr:hypothetical protein BDN71DRAFT_1436336 [Pleurotus eryngii]
MCYILIDLALVDCDRSTFLNLPPLLQTWGLLTGWASVLAVTWWLDLIPMYPSLKSYIVFAFAWMALENTALSCGGWPHSQDFLCMFPDKTALAHGAEPAQLRPFRPPVGENIYQQLWMKQLAIHLNVSGLFRQVLPSRDKYQCAIGLGQGFYPCEALIFVAGGNKCAPVNPGGELFPCHLYIIY